MRRKVWKSIKSGFIIFILTREQYGPPQTAETPEGKDYQGYKSDNTK